MKKFFLVLLFCLVGLVAALAFSKDYLLHKGVIAGTRFATGMELAIEKLKLRLISSDLAIEGLTLMNPMWYEERKMLSVPEIYTSLSIPSLFKKEIYVREMRLNLDELVVVKNKDGKVNIMELKALASSRKGKSAEKAAEMKEEAGKTWPLRVKRLELSIGKVVYKDYSRGGEPKTQVFNVGINKEVYYDIDHPKTFISVLLTRSLAKTSIAKLANLDMSEIQTASRQAIQNSIQMAREEMKKGVGFAREKATQLKQETAKGLESTREKTKAATVDLKEGMTEATKDIKGLFTTD